MSDVTRILEQLEAGDRQASDQLLPLVYDELRKLAAAKLAREGKEHTLQATALVHEAYVRLVQPTAPQQWNGRGHFFAAAATCMRRILVQRARMRNAEKRGGQHARVDAEIEGIASATPSVDLLALDAALEELKQVDPQAAQLVELRYFAGLTGRDAADALGVSPRTADRIWAFARSWLLNALSEN